MTHEYTLLVGGRVVPGAGQPDATAIAWAEDTILAIGSDEAVRSISRGDSRLVDLGGALVTGVDDSPLEVGGDADLVVAGGSGSPIAVVRGGLVVEGSLGVED